AQPRDVLYGLAQVSGLIALAAMRLRCQVRRVRLNGQPLQRQACRDAAGLLGLGVGADARYRDDEAHLYVALCQRQVTGEAMQHAQGPALRQPGVASVFGEDVERLFLGVPRVDDDRQPDLDGHRELPAEGAALLLRSREVAVEVEADLADGDDLRRRRQRSQLGQRLDV